MPDENDDMELIRGFGNVFADFRMADAELRQLRAIMAAEIIKSLDDEGQSVREAEKRTGVAAADFSRICQVKLQHFTIDRFMQILDRLNCDVHVSVTITPRTEGAREYLALQTA
jgi:predicted XRE-type DNA-binding protein